MGRTWPLKKATHDDKVGSSRAKQKKETDMPWMNLNVAWAFYH
jgi:hypothetical protein